MDCGDCLCEEGFLWLGLVVRVGAGDEGRLIMLGRAGVLVHDLQAGICGLSARA